MMKKVFLNLLVLFFSLLFFFIVAEIISEYVYNSPSFIVKLNKEVHTTGADYVLSQNKELIYEGNYTLNKYLNPTNYKKLLQKEKDTFRMLILGDSIAASFINGTDQYFSDKLEAELSKTSDIRLQVVNSAVSGYSTIQEAEYFEMYGVKLKPDLVVVLFCTNDFDLLNAISKEKDGAIKLIAYRGDVPFLINNSFSRFLIMRSYFYRFLNEMSIDIANKYNKKLKVYHYLISEEKNRGALNKIIRLSKENDITLLVVVFPRLENFTEYSKMDLHNEIKIISQENNVFFLDLLDSFKTYNYRELRLNFDDDTHPNKSGYDLAIDGIIDYLKKQRLIPEKNKTV